MDSDEEWGDFGDFQEGSVTAQVNVEASTGKDAEGEEWGDFLASDALPRKEKNESVSVDSSLANTLVSAQTETLVTVESASIPKEKQAIEDGILGASSGSGDAGWGDFEGTSAEDGASPSTKSGMEEVTGDDDDWGDFATASPQNAAAVEETPSPIEEFPNANVKILEREEEKVSGNDRMEDFDFLTAGPSSKRMVSDTIAQDEAPKDFFATPENTVHGDFDAHSDGVNVPEKVNLVEGMVDPEQGAVSREDDGVSDIVMEDLGSRSTDDGKKKEEEEEEEEWGSLMHQNHHHWRRMERYSLLMKF